MRSSTCRRRSSTRAQHESDGSRLERGQDVPGSEPVVDNATWEKLARQFYTLHSALRPKR